jgi:methyl-accepting chemotaxis protein
MNLTKMRVGQRLGVGFALVLALLTIVTIVAIWGMGTIQGRLNYIVGMSNVETRIIIDMRAIVAERNVSLRNLTLLTDADEMEGDLKKIAEQKEKYAELKNQLISLFKEDADSYNREKTLLDQLSESEAATAELPEKAKALGLSKDMEMATISFIKKIRPIQAKWISTLDAMLETKDTQSITIAAEANESYAKVRMWIIILGVVALSMGILAGFVITRSLLKQLGGEPEYAVEIAGQIAAGDLATEIQTKAGDQDSLLMAMKVMRDSLVNIVAQVRVGTDTIATASSEIASGNMDLSSRTEQQASSLEKTTASMRELTGTVKQNADNAREANKLAATASDVARQGGEVVAEVVNTMSSINESAKKIVDIISVIDGIAFQTNILALNAAVEAARAGEQGRGFAVVASEVRSLAQRSAAAAKEIKTLIGDSVEKVEIGTKLVGQAGTTIDQVVSSVRHVTDIIAEISSASQEQSAGIEAVNHSIIEMDGMTQQNAALVEEAAAAAQSMQDQASELTKVVSIFKMSAYQGHQQTQQQTHQESYSAPVQSKVANVTQTKKAPVQKIAAKPAKPAPALKASAKSASAPKAAPSNNDDWEEF